MAERYADFLAHYPRRTTPLLPARGHRVRVFRVHGRVSAMHLATEGEEVWDEKVSDKDRSLQSVPGRAHLVVTPGEWNSRMGTFVSLPTTSSDHMGQYPASQVLWVGDQYGVHIAFPNCFPTDHRAVDDFYYDDAARKRISRLRNSEVLAELRTRVSRGTIRGMPEAGRERIGRNHIIPGMIVRVAFGREGPARVPCVVLSVASQPPAGRKDRVPIVVLQTVAWEADDDADSGRAPGMAVIHPPVGGLTDNRTLFFELIRGIDPVAREVQPWNPRYSPDWPIERVAAECCVAPDFLRRVQDGVEAVLWAREDD